MQHFILHNGNTVHEKIMVESKLFKFEQDFVLENGNILPGIQITYHTYGSLNIYKSNVIWACHALTANSDVCIWWKGLFGEECLYNPSEHFIVCANILGSCYGTTGPVSTKPDFRKSYYLHFPDITIKDIVKAHQLLADHLNIDKINTLIGGSLGGQQALEWAITEPERIINLVVLATNAQHSPWGIAFNESQRMAILADSTVYTEKEDAGAAGLRAARSIALLSYRTYEVYSTTQKEENLTKTNDFKAASYQRYQGNKLQKRFNSYSYYTLTKTMDSHNVGRGRGSNEEALKSIQARTLVIAFRGDILFPPVEQQYLAAKIPNAKYYEIHSHYGHDGFLIETKKITTIIQNYNRMVHQITRRSGL